MGTEKEKYANCMAEIKRRVAIMNAIVSGWSPLNSEDFDGELLCLHLRKTLEMIAFASLSANKNVYEKVHRDFSTQWNAKRLIKTLKKLNAEYFPKPMRLASPEDKKIKHFEYLKKGFLTEEDLIFLYNKCGDVLHSRNPFKLGRNIINFRRPLSEWIIRIQKLLTIHQIRLVDSDETWIVLIDGGDGKVHVLAAKPVSHGQIPSSQKNS